MAITKIHAIKSTLGKALAYIENPDKTDGQMLVSGYNCEPQTASIDFEMTAVLAHKARNLKRKRSTNVYIPLDNARYTMYTLRNLAGWIDAMPREKMDIVQWNNLEWDIGEFYQDGPLTPLPFYVDTLRRIYQRIRLFFPNAEIIYATGTKVIDEKSPVDPNFERHNSVIEIYNQAAAELMAELNVRVNDLYKISEAFNEEYYSDWVHPNYLGSRLLAEQVVRFLKL